MGAGSASSGKLNSEKSAACPRMTRRFIFTTGCHAGSTGSASARAAASMKSSRGSAAPASAFLDLATGLACVRNRAGGGRGGGGAAFRGRGGGAGGGVAAPPPPLEPQSGEKRHKRRA